MLIIQHLKPEYLIKIQEYFEITDSSLVKT